MLSLLLVAVNLVAAPGKTTYQARIVKPDGYPLEANNVNFQFSILDPTGSCVIYVETYSAVNMANSGGLISFSLGSGVRTFPASSTTIASVFDNSTISYSCQTPGIYSPIPTDNRKIVMQFNHGTGWQTLPAMSINAVPYAMYADKADNSALLNGKADIAFVEYSTIPTCATSTHALHYNGAGFTCIATGGGSSYTVTSADVTSALGYTPISPATLSASYTSTTSFSTVTATVSNLGTSVTAVTSAINSLSVSLAAMISSQWVTSGTTISYNNGNVSVSGALLLSSGAASGPSYSFATDTDTGFYRPSANSIALVTSGSEKLSIYGDTVDLVGSVQIDPYTIYSQVPMQINGTGQDPGYSFANGSAMFSPSVNVLAFATSTQERFRITPAGLVGINTLTPVTRLDVSGAIRIGMESAACAASYAGAIRYNAGVVEFCNGTSWNTFTAGAVTNANVLSALGYTPASHTTVTNLTSSMTSVFSTLSVQASSLTNLSNSYSSLAASVSAIAASGSQWLNSGSDIYFNAGRVGVGSDNPLFPLQVSGTAHADKLRVGFAAGTNFLMDYRNTSPLAHAGAWGWVLRENFTGVDKIFIERQSDGGDIIFNGNLGVGFNVPTAKLHLASGTTTVAPFKFTSGSLLASPQSGTVEYDGNFFYITDGSNTRRAVATVASPGNYENASTISNTGNISLAPTGSVIVSSTTASTNAQTGALVVQGGLGVGGNANITGSLNVSGAIHSSSFLSGASLMYLYATGASFTNAADAYAAGHRGFVADLGDSTAWDLMTLKNVSGTQFVVEGGGYTGIGTSDPDRRLTIIGDGTNYGDDVMIEATNNDSTGTLAQINLAKSRGNPSARTTILAGDTMGALAFRGYDGSSFAYGGLIKSVAETNFNVSENADLRFQTTSGGLTADRMVINSLGNIGIGLVSPTARLYVAGNNSAGAIGAVSAIIIVQNSNTTSGALNTFMFANHDGFANAAISTVQSVTGNVGNRMVLQTKAVSGGAWNTDQLSLGTNGFIGIGTSAPTRLVTLSGANIGMNFYDTAYTNSLINIYNSGGNGKVDLFSGATNVIRLSAQNNENSFINSGANFGVGMNAPNSRLVVRGAAATSATSALHVIDSVNNSMLYVRNDGNVGIGTSTPTSRLNVYEGDIVIERTTTSPSLRLHNSFTGGRQYALYSHASGSGGFSRFIIKDNTSGTERLTISDNGDVGINTAVPYSMLDVVSGAIRATRTSYGNVQYLEVYGGDSVQTAPYLRANSDEGNKKPLMLQSFHDGSGSAAGNLGFFFQLGAASAPVDVLTIRETGSVGIGTTQPSEKIHVEAADGGRIAISSGSVFSTSGYGLSLESDTDQGVSYLNLHTASMGANVAAFIIRGGHGPSENASTRTIANFQTDTGNVGFGNDNPQFLLHLGGQEAAPGTSGSITRMAFTPYGHTGGPFTVVNRDFGADAFLDFKYHGSGAHLLTMEDGGKIGMGVSMPTQRLHLGGNMQIDGDIYGGLYGGTRGIWRFSTADPNFGIFYTEGSPDKISFSPNGGGTSTPNMVIHGGNVGIGVSTPTYQLQLSTDSAGKPGTNTWSIASDMRLKDSRAPFTRSIDALMGLETIYFTYKKDNDLGLPSDREYVGIRAQDVQKVIPEAVSVDKKGYLQFTSDAVFWTMVNAIKELYHKWTQDSEVLHQKVQNLEAENRAMRDYLCQKDPGAPFCQRLPASSEK